MEDLIKQISLVVSEWKNSYLAGMIALTNLLVYISKLPQLDKYIKSKWRPWIAVATGVVLAMLAALIKGSNIPNAILSGIMVGLGAIGVDQVAKTVQPTTQSKLEAGKAVAMALEGERADVAPKVEAMKAALDAAKHEPDKKTRLKALADLVNNDVATPAGKVL